MCQVQEDYKNLLRGRVPHFCPCTMSQHNDLDQTSTLTMQACSTPFDRRMNRLTKCSSLIQRRTSLANPSRGVSPCTNVCHPFHLTIHCELCEDLSSDALPHITGYTYKGSRGSRAHAQGTDGVESWFIAESAYNVPRREALEIQKFFILGYVQKHGGHHFVLTLSWCLGVYTASSSGFRRGVQSDGVALERSCWLEFSRQMVNPKRC
jgi:hypothetical protein